MDKQDQIPTTQFVSRYQASAPKQQMDIWLSSIAGFCNGAQSPKLNGDIVSIRIGAMVFAEGKVTLDGVITSVSVMPVVPRNDGFVMCCASDGSIKGARYSAGSKAIDFSGFSAGEYMISVSYIANQKEYK